MSWTWASGQGSGSRVAPVISWSDGAVLVGTALQFVGVVMIAREIRGTRTHLAVPHEPWWRKLWNKRRKTAVVPK